MLYTSSILLAVITVLGLISPALTAGTMTLQNKCTYDVYLQWYWESPSGNSTIHQLTAAGESYNLATHPTGSVWKICRHLASDGVECLIDHIVQVENTLDGNGNWPDLSNVNTPVGGTPPFVAEGMSLSFPGGSAGTDTCPDKIECPPGQNPCLAAFRPGTPVPDEGHHCPDPDTNMLFVACSG